jgi:hypothetical protein
MLHKLRRAMVAPEQTPLEGPVELVVVAVEVRAAGSGRLPMKVIEDACPVTWAQSTRLQM